MSALETVNLTKRFGPGSHGFIAVDHVSLTIPQGTVFALIGPNGAGKTTILKLIVGLLLPTSGTAQIYGHSLAREPLKTKKLFGYIPDDPSAYEYLSGWEFLILTGRLRGMDAASLKSRIAELAEVFPIKQIIHQPMSQYSRGNKQKVAFLSSLLTKPKLLIIDEPIVGLDPASIAIMGETLVSYVQNGNTVFFVTHILSFAQLYATQAGVMKEGKLTDVVDVHGSASLETLL